MTDILMPKGTAVWLVENTSLTFEQIAKFCSLHVLEVKGIADGDVAAGMKGRDPIISGQITREEIKKAEQDQDYLLKAIIPKHKHLYEHKRKGPRYTPLSRRHDKPNAIAWLLHHHPDLTDTQIIKLIGTTKTTIHSIKNRTHKDTENIRPADPVTLGLCLQTDLDLAISKIKKKKK